MAEVITTAPKSKEAEIKLLFVPFGELTLHLGDDGAFTAIKAIANFSTTAARAISKCCLYLMQISPVSILIS